MLQRNPEAPSSSKMGDTQQQFASPAPGSLQPCFKGKGMQGLGKRRRGETGRRRAYVGRKTV